MTSYIVSDEMLDGILEKTERCDSDFNEGVMYAVQQIKNSAKQINDIPHDNWHCPAEDGCHYSLEQKEKSNLQHVTNDKPEASDSLREFTDESTPTCGVMPSKKQCRTCKDMDCTMSGAYKQSKHFNDCEKDRLNEKYGYKPKIGDKIKHNRWASIEWLLVEWVDSQGLYIAGVDNFGERNAYNSHNYRWELLESGDDPAQQQREEFGYESCCNAYLACKRCDEEERCVDSLLKKEMSNTQASPDTPPPELPDKLVINSPHYTNYSGVINQLRDYCAWLGERVLN